MGISCNSKHVKKNDCFVAIAGSKFDGHDYIADAIKNGASEVIYEKAINNQLITENPGVVFYKVENSRARLAQLLSKEYQQPKNIVAITGTNGKTSVAYFYFQICSMLNLKAASIGTLGVVSNVNSVDQVIGESNLTTPDPISLHKILEALAKNEVSHVAMEASSIGLDQHRLDGVKLAAAAFTNFTQDHLDYHGSMSEYFKAKRRLFSELLPAGASACLNVDIKEFEDLRVISQRKNLDIVTYGARAANFQILRINHGKTTQIELDCFGTKYNTSTNIVGEFQIYNILCAIALAYSTNAGSINQIIATIPFIKAAVGRLQAVEGYEVYIDYCHTPDALSRALMALRKNLTGNLILVFGCGGDRDPGKRELMGEIADKLCDVAIVTDDNPRTEDPLRIREQIISGMSKATEIADRKQAIEYAISIMKKDDRVLIAGKGHENYQIYGEKIIEFNDYEVAKNYLNMLKEKF